MRAVRLVPMGAVGGSDTLDSSGWISLPCAALREICERPKVTVKCMFQTPGGARHLLEGLPLSTLFRTEGVRQELVDSGRLKGR